MSFQLINRINPVFIVMPSIRKYLTTQKIQSQCTILKNPHLFSAKLLPNESWIKRKSKSLIKNCSGWSRARGLWHFRLSARCSDSSCRIISPLDGSGRWLIHGLLLLLLFLLPQPPNTSSLPHLLLSAANYGIQQLFRPPAARRRICARVALTPTDPDSRVAGRWATWRLNEAFWVGVWADGDTSVVTLQMQCREDCSGV